VRPEIGWIGVSLYNIEPSTHSVYSLRNNRQPFFDRISLPRRSPKNVAPGSRRLPRLGHQQPNTRKTLGKRVIQRRSHGRCMVDDNGRSGSCEGDAKRRTSRALRPSRTSSPRSLKFTSPGGVPPPSVANHYLISNADVKAIDLIESGDRWLLNGRAMPACGSYGRATGYGNSMES
jgi:hypothetical protein